jgi:hypothetical protein
MKKSKKLFFLALILGIVLASCSKDISGPVDLNYLEGKWIFNKSTASYSGFTIPYTTDYLKNEEGCTKDYIEIYSGNSIKLGNYTPGCAYDEKIGTWSLDGNKVIISVLNSNLNGTFNVVSLSETELILTIEGTYEGKPGTINLYLNK